MFKLNNVFRSTIILRPAANLQIARSFDMRQPEWLTWFDNFCPDAISPIFTRLALQVSLPNIPGKFFSVTTHQYKWYLFHNY